MCHHCNAAGFIFLGWHGGDRGGRRRPGHDLGHVHGPVVGRRGDGGPEALDAAGVGPPASATTQGGDGSRGPEDGGSEAGHLGVAQDWSLTCQGKTYSRLIDSHSSLSGGNSQ